MRSEQILVINTASVPAPDLMRRAREVAKALGHDLNVWCLLDDTGLPPALPADRDRVGRVRRKLLWRCRNALEKVLEEAEASGMTAHGDVRTTESVADAVLELVATQPPAFVMISRRPHTRFQEATLAGDDFAIIRSCPVPVWVVNPAHAAGDKIVGAVDGFGDTNGSAELDERILDHAARLARKLGKENHALHTFGQAGLSRPLPPAAGNPADDMGTSSYDRRMHRAFDFGKAHGVPRERVHIHEGKLVNALEEMSEPMNADLIILGARSRGRLRRVLSRSAAERVVQRVNADVLILKGTEQPRTAEAASIN
ncbi:MAG TPA: universal stress protein [Woeseiaceae bacterium]|nr:universal stress protein [Woeseiaceae bacterium]